MIKTIVFDFGNVFLNIDIEGALQNALKTFKIKKLPKDVIAINSLYEQGLLSSNEFIDFYADNFNHLSKQDIIDNWNFMLRDFPLHRLEFLKALKASSQYKLILLSNTNELHIDWVKKQVPFYYDFKKSFDAFYLSHEIKMRKPNADIFKFVLEENKIAANSTLFIDDNTENTEAAKKMGFHVWNINPVTEDVTTLFKTKKDLF